MNGRGGARSWLLPLFLLLILVGWWIWNRPSTTDRDDRPIDASGQPIQEGVARREPFRFDRGSTELELVPVARYRIAARVLGRRKYRRGWAGKLSPVDLALGWGPVIRQESLKYLKFKQIVRFYQYRLLPGCPLDQVTVARNSSNHHIIPASQNVRRAVLRLGKGDLVELEGYLVDVKGTHRDRPVWWKTSRTRTDTGNGACELMYVEQVRRGDRVYR